MKKKICYVFLYIIACFAFMNNVFAFDYSAYANVVDDKTTVKEGESTTILVGIKSAEQVASCVFNVSSDTSLVLTDSAGMIGNGWTKSGSGDNGILVENSLSSDPMPEGKSVLSLTYQVNGNGVVTIKSECSPLNGNEMDTYEDIKVELKAMSVSEDYTLSDLKVAGGTIEPKFASNVNNYILNLDSPNFGLELSASNPDYNDKIVVTTADGSVIGDLSNITFSDPSAQGKMPINITVNEKGIYSILAIYEKKELDNGLSFLKVDGRDVLEVGKNEYVINVASNVENVKIEAQLKDSENFKFDEAFENGFMNLQLSSVSHEFTIFIEPKDPSSGARDNSYTITVVRDYDGPATGSSSSSSRPNVPSSNRPSSSYGNTERNPSTGGISMGFMAVILIASLLGSVILYKKNLEGYDK